MDVLTIANVAERQKRVQGHLHFVHQARYWQARVGISRDWQNWRESLTPRSLEAMLCIVSNTSHRPSLPAFSCHAQTQMTLARKFC